MKTGTTAYTELAARNRRDRLIHEHLPLVKHVLGRLLARLPRGADVENLESAGLLGLVEAAGKFDPERGIRFETYAYRRIRGAVLDELRRNCPLPQHVLEQAMRVRRAYQELPPPVTVEALAAATGLNSEAVVESLEALRLTRLWGRPDPTEVLEAQKAGVEEQPEHRAESAEQRQRLAAAITALPERKRIAVTLYYLEDLRLKEIGEVLGLSESRVSRVLSEALFELRERLRTDEE